MSDATAITILVVLWVLLVLALLVGEWARRRQDRNAG